MPASRCQPSLNDATDDASTASLRSAATGGEHADSRQRRIGEPFGPAPRIVQPARLVTTHHQAETLAGIAFELTERSGRSAIGASRCSVVRGHVGTTQIDAAAGHEASREARPDRR